MHSQELRWSCQRFCELSPEELYQILALRSQVFVVEQQCAYLDPDGQDRLSGTYHLCGWQGETLVGYLRLLAPVSAEYNQAMIGRVVVSPAQRGQGIAHHLLERGVAECRRLWPSSNIGAHAQSYLEDFYLQHEFRVAGEEELEDGIPHKMMLLCSQGQLEARVVDFSGQNAEAIAYVREQVFTLEQGIDAAIDLDGLDPASTQVLVYEGETPVATGRMQSDGHIGRIAVLKAHRGSGVGRLVVETLIESARLQQLPRVYLGAQCHAIDFYQQLGFKAYGSEFEEAGLPHQMMELNFD
ncbi:GNAT family N-acetyltransferase [Dongshaea marina]|uniref:GNAT family N-acetyltransferase n=1 Tax=Dongshaea marina TaxID=2047966 RepID=UPI001F193AA9|nr:GNAT family N-acetyltransferase [Dongshaea marina]